MCRCLFFLTVACALHSLSLTTTYAQTIEVGYLSTAEKAGATEWIRRETRLFIQNNPNASIHLRQIFAPTRDQRTKIPLAGLPQLPNVVGLSSWHCEELRSLIAADLLLPLDGLIESTDSFGGGFPAHSLDPVTYKGKVYGVPWATELLFLVADTRYVTKEDAASIQSWADLEQAAGAVGRRHATTTPTVTGLRLPENRDVLGMLLLTMLAQKGDRSIINGDFAYKPVLRQVVQYLKSLQEAEFSALAPTAVFRIMPTQQLGSLGSHVIILALPSFKKPVQADTETLYFAIRRSSDEEERLSWEVIRWLLRPGQAPPPAIGGYPLGVDFEGRQRKWLSAYPPGVQRSFASDATLVAPVRPRPTGALQAFVVLNQYAGFALDGIMPVDEALREGCTKATAFIEQ